MKKKILLIVLVVCLVIGGIGGVIYANGEHEPMKGEKLVGLALMGTVPNRANNLGKYEYYPIFQVTNPDCSSPITIKGLSIIKQDGTTMYQGPLVSPLIYPEGADSYREIIDTILPHQVIKFQLPHYQWKGEGQDPDDVTAMDNWDWDGVPTDSNEAYTFEISYELEKNAAPLIGWQRTWCKIFIEDTDNKVGDYGTESPMVNVKQK